jgi:outer membrane protein OmpA-like peptidoglycan-associated protein
MKTLFLGMCASRGAWRCILCFLFFSLSILVKSVNIQAQTDAPSDSDRTLRIGGFVGGALNWHIANFENLPGIPAGRPGDGILFKGALGFSPTAGISLEYPFSESVAAALRLSYAGHSGTLEALEPQRVGAVSADGSAVSFYDAIFRRELQSNLGSLGIEPLLIFHPFQSGAVLSGLRFLLGARLGLFLSRNFSQRETILSLEPVDDLAPNVAFNNNERVRNEIPEQEIPGLQAFHLAASAGVGYDIRIGSSLVITPEAMYSFGFTPLVQNLAWDLHQGRLVIGLRYKLPPPPPPPPPRQRLALEATVAAFTTDTSGREAPLVQIKVEEFVSRQMYPLLPYIFFDYGSSVIPARYHRLTPDEAANFNENAFLNADAMRVYYDVLNIIGKRLKDNPSTKITITGCNDNVSPREIDNETLSRSRAEEVRQYIKRTWNIDTNRMTLRVRNLPEKPTMSKDSAGIEENRRVEISSASWEIMQPSLVYDTLLVPSAPVIRFKTTVFAEDGVAKSTLRAFQRDRTLKQYTALSALDPVVEWNTAREQTTIPRTEDKMKFTYEVIDSEGRVAMPEDSVPVEQVTIRKKRSLRIKDKEIDTYRLILFDFDSPEVGPENAQIIKTLVLPNVKPQSTVQVTGFTDRIGSADVNQRLSEGRARNVSNLISSRQATAKGLGAKMIIYPNEIPEGRFLSRTVEVRVETPIDD